MYYTYSSPNPDGSERFRLIYGIDCDCNNEDIAVLLSYVAKGGQDIFDKACKDASRIFFATNTIVSFYEDYKLLGRAKIDELKQLDTDSRKKQHAKVYEGGSNYTDDVVDQLKQIDIGRHLENQGYQNVEKYRGGYRMPCPIHNGKNKNFLINKVNGVWLYTCFSKCGGDGGSIIDLHQKLNNLDTGQAIKELCSIYNIVEVKTLSKNRRIFIDGKL